MRKSVGLVGAAVLVVVAQLGTVPGPAFASGVPTAADAPPGELTGGVGLPLMTPPVDPAEVDQNRPRLADRGPLPSGTASVTGAAAAGAGTVVGSLPLMISHSTLQAASRGGGQPSMLQGWRVAVHPQRGSRPATSLVVSVTPQSTPGVPNTPGTTTGAQSGTTASATLSLDYSSFGGRFGDSWGSRLNVHLLGGCPASSGLGRSTVKQQVCSRLGPSLGRNDAGKWTLTWPVHIDTGSAATPAAVRFVIVAGPSGPGGSYNAAPLPPSAGWQVGVGSGDFSYSYPVSTPADFTGAQTQVSLDYSSQSVDGMTSAENTQAGQAGIGWQLSTPYIARTYTPCDEDGQGWADWCWLTAADGTVVEDVSIVIDGHSEPLVQDPNDPNSYRLAHDPGWQVTHHHDNPNVTNADNNDEYWVVDEPDGTSLTFGAGHVDGATNSVWTMPVFGNDAGEQCHASTVDASWCQQGYRWNLDKVVDPNGNITVYRYDTDTNYYGRNGTPTLTTPYDRDGWLTEVDAGKKDASTTATARLVVTTVLRCLSKIQDGTACNPPGSDPGDYPDVPTDLLCSAQATSCDSYAPAFFSTRRLDSAQGQAYKDGGWVNADTWDFGFTMPDPDGAGGDERQLWLNTVTRTGKGGGSSQSLPAVNFDGTALQNRVDDQGVLPLLRYRVTSVRNETGGRLTVSYGQPSGDTCAIGDLGGFAGRRQNKDCFIQEFDPDGPGGQDPGFGWFHKYLVLSVEQTDDALGIYPDNHAVSENSLGNRQLVTYAYSGTPGWRSADSRSSTTDQKPGSRYWTDWRGYGTTVVRHKNLDASGDVLSDQSATTYLVFRGLSEDYDNNDSDDQTTPVYLDPEEAGESPEDTNRMAGLTAEVSTANGSGVEQVRDYYDYGFQSRTIDTDPVLGTDAWMIRQTLDHHHVIQDDGGQLNQTITSDYQPVDQGDLGPAMGMVTSVDDQGRDDDSGDNVCVTTSYYGNNDSGYWIAAPREVDTFHNTCSGPQLAQTNYYYDQMSAGVGDSSLLVHGNLTDERDHVEDTGTPFVETQATYDVLGRVLSTTDGDTNVTHYAYNPGGDPTGPLEETSTTNPEGWTTTTALGAARSQPVTITDPNTYVTNLHYDPLGRLDTVDLPGTPGSVDSISYSYNDSATSPSSVKTTTLRNADKQIFDHAWSYTDGWGRQIETQVPQPDGDGGRLVTETGYDDQGLPHLSTAAFNNADAPGSFLVGDLGSVDEYWLSSFDWAGRQTKQQRMANGVDQNATTTWAYDAASTTVDPPNAAPTEYDYTIRGWLTDVVQHDFDGSVIAHATYGYTPTGQLNSVEFPGPDGYTNTYAYDWLGRRTSESDVDSGTTTYSYDDNNNLTAVDNPDPGRVAYTYDDLNRPTRVLTQTDDGGSWTDGPALIDYGYDPTGHLGDLDHATSHTDLGDFTTTFTGYDAKDQPTGETWSWPAGITSGSSSFHQGFGYNDASELTSVADDAVADLPAENVTDTYTINGLFSQETSDALDPSGPGVAQATYGTFGRVKELDSGGSQTQMTRGYGFDTTTGWLSDLTVGDGAGATSLDMAYQYDAAGMPKTVDDTVGSIDTTTSYGYDGAQRLTSATATQPDGTTVFDQTYSYGPAGGIDLIHSADTAPAGDPSNGYDANYTYTPGGDPTTPHAVKSVSAGPAAGSYGYDDAGRLTGWSSPDQTQTRTSTYTPLGQLAQVSLDDDGTPTRSRYASWPDGTRAVTITDSGDGTAATITLDVADTTVVTDQDAAGPGGTTGGNGGGDLHASTATRSYTTPAGVLVAQHDTTSGWRWLATDTHGSVVDAVAADGTTTHTRYYPFGQPTTTGPPDGTVGTGYLGRFHTGIDTDTTTGAVPGNPNAGVAAAPGDTITTPTRDYATSLGRFTTPDPLFDTADPASLNPYTYADDNPIAKTDPDGNYFRSDNDTAPWWVSDIILADGDTSQQAVAKTEADLQHDQSEMEPLALHYSVHPVTWGGFLGGVYDMTLGVVAGTVEGAADSAITFSPLGLLAPGLASELQHGVDSVIATGVNAAGGNTHSRAFSTGQFLALAGAIIAAGAGAGAAADAATLEGGAVETTAESAGAANGGSDVVRHYTTREAAENIMKGGQINPGKSGKIWITPDEYASGAQARTRLSLDKTPDGYFEIPMCRVQCPSAPSKVEPWAGQPGGGIEITTEFPIDIRGLIFKGFE